MLVCCDSSVEIKDGDVKMNANCKTEVLWQSQKHSW